MRSNDENWNENANANEIEMENAINLMRQIVASAFGEQPIKLYEFLTYGILRYLYIYIYIACYVVMAFVADVCKKMTKYFRIYIS